MSRSDVAVVEAPIGTGSDAGIVQGAHDQEVLHGRGKLQAPSPSPSQEAGGEASTKTDETDETNREAPSNVANNAVQANDSTRNATAAAAVTANSNGNSPSNSCPHPRSLQGHDALQLQPSCQSSTMMEQLSNRISTAHIPNSPHASPSPSPSPSSSLHRQERQGGQGESTNANGGAPIIPRDENPNADCTSATVTPHRLGQDPGKNLGGGHGAMIMLVEHEDPVPPAKVIRETGSPELARDITPVTPKSTLSTASSTNHPTATAEQLDSHHKRSSLSTVFRFKHQAQSSATTAGATQEGNMFFGPANVPGTAAHRRKTYANTNAITDYEADLTSRDRDKQKHAVRRYINETVKGDWEWEWPQPPGGQDDNDSNSLNDPGIEWKERDEWLSDNSEAGDSPPIPGSTIVFDTKVFKPSLSPFRFENPDGVGETIQKSQRDRKRRRKRRNKEEMKYNDGVRCFNERRDAWTRARHVPAPPRKPSVQTTGSSEGDGSSTAINNYEDDGWEDSDTEIPIAPPLLPPTNAMRASIKPDAYNTIYDKVVLQQLTPSCPINLTDVVRSCVQGWKRDGEWPPKGTQPEPLVGKKKPRKLSVAGIFGFDKDKDGQKEPGSPSTIRRSLQRLISLGKDHDRSAPSSPATPGLQGSEKSKEVEKAKEDTLKPVA